MSSQMITAVAGAVDTLGNLVSAPVNDYYARKAEERQEEANIRAEGREQNYIISAEQRANEEYNRRLADQRAYDDPQAVAARYAKAGINPVSAFQSGVVGQTGSISPSGGRAASGKPITAQRTNFTAPQTLDVISSLAQIENIKADTEAKKAGIDKTFEEIVGIKFANRVAAVEADLAEATKSDNIAISAKKVEEAEELVNNLRQERENMIKDGLLKDKELEIFDKRLEELDSNIALNYALVALRENEVEVGNAQIEHWKRQDELAKQDLERLRKQGLAGLRIDAAQLGLDKKQFDWDKERVAIEQELKQQGLNIDWSKLGQSALTAIATALAIYYTGGAAAGAKGAAKIVSNIVKRVPFK